MGPGQGSAWTRLVGVAKDVRVIALAIIALTAAVAAVLALPKSNGRKAVPSPLPTVYANHGAAAGGNITASNIVIEDAPEPAANNAKP